MFLCKSHDRGNSAGAVGPEIVENHFLSYFQVSNSKDETIGKKIQDPWRTFD
jgi:hypothetical protein